MTYGNFIPGRFYEIIFERRDSYTAIANRNDHITTITRDKKPHQTSGSVSTECSIREISEFQAYNPAFLPTDNNSAVAFLKKEEFV